MKVAVLVDAAFFIRRYHALGEANKGHTGAVVAETLHAWACKHSTDDGTGHGVSRYGQSDLYRIFVYDCPPYDGGLHTPIEKKWINFKKTPLYTFRTEFHERLRQLRKVALRLGHLGEVRTWVLKEEVQQALLKRERDASSLTDEDVTLNTKQKGVDMRIGVDVASLAFKKQVDRVVLVAGDADFVPAAKLARREGLDFVLDSMHAPIARNLYEHIDGLVSMAPRPKHHQEHKHHPPKDFTQSASYDVKPSSIAAATIAGQTALADHFRRLVSRSAIATSPVELGTPKPTEDGPTDPPKA